MVFTADELVQLVDELRERGVTYFKVEGAEISMEVPKLVEEETEIAPVERTPADELLYYSS
jgi:hypothetical protein